MSLSGRWKSSGHKGGERFVLLILDLYEKAEQPCGVKELIEETGMSLRQILRIVEDLKADGSIHTTGGKGRSPYIIKLGSYNEDKMSSQTASSDDIKSPDKMSSEVRSDDKMSSLYDAETLCQDKPAPSDDILSGTKVAPSKAETISSNTSQVSPSAQLGAASTAKVVQHPSAKPETDHQRMMRELASRLHGIPDGGKQGKHAKWLLGQGHTVDECVECLDDLRAQEWRDTRVDWGVVAKEIGSWKERQNANGNGTAKQTRRADGGARQPPRTPEAVNRDWRAKNIV